MRNSNPLKTALLTIEGAKYTVVGKKMERIGFYRQRTEADGSLIAARGAVFASEETNSEGYQLGVLMFSRQDDGMVMGFALYDPETKAVEQMPGYYTPALVERGATNVSAAASATAASALRKFLNGVDVKDIQAEFAPHPDAFRPSSAPDFS